MGFEETLRRLSQRAHTGAKRELATHTRDIARLIHDVIERGKSYEISVRTKDHLTDTILDAKFAAEILDASECVNDCVLRAKNGLICDLRLGGRSLDQIQDDIHGEFLSGAAPNRGFVYVAWTANPTLYTYVGKASNAGRLNLASHGKLAHAAAYTSTISLLFPSQSREDTLLNVEASIIRLIEHQTGELPELNVKPEQVPEGSASRDLQGLATFLDVVADAVEPFDTRA